MKAIKGLPEQHWNNCYFSKGDYESALAYFQQALQLRERSQGPAAKSPQTVYNLAGG